MNAKGIGTLDKDRAKAKEEGRIMKHKDKLTVCGMALYAAVIFCVFLAWGLHGQAVEIPEPTAPMIATGGLTQQKEVIEAEPLVYITPEVVDPVMLLEEVTEPTVHVIENCVITYYCAEQYAHICGTGDGITATEARVTPGVTCAVDPAVIPFGSVVCVDYGDGVLHEYVAQDSGAWVNDDHIDICVETHSEALELGTRTATVYWEESV